MTPFVGAVATLDDFVADRRLISVSTAKQGMALDVAYAVRFRKDRQVDELVKALNRLEGIFGRLAKAVLAARGFVPSEAAPAAS